MSVASWIFAFCLPSPFVVMVVLWFVIPTAKRLAPARFAGPDAKAIAESLSEHPEEWSRDSDSNRVLGKTYRIIHRSGLQVWVGNEAYGLHVAPRGDHGPQIWGVMKGGTTADQWLVWNAAQNVLHRGLGNYDIPGLLDPEKRPGARVMPPHSPNPSKGER